MRLLVQKEYKAGDPAPSGYLAWHEWADTQSKAGLKQVACGRCGLYKFPQELSSQVDISSGVDRRGVAHQTQSNVCICCAKV